MIVDLRTYTLTPGRMAQYLERYRTHGYPVHTEHVGQPLAYMTSEIGGLNQVVHLWRYDSLADREQKRERLERDERWMRYRKAMWEAGDLQHQTNSILRLVEF